MQTSRSSCIKCAAADERMALLSSKSAVMLSHEVPRIQKLTSLITQGQGQGHEDNVLTLALRAERQSARMSEIKKGRLGLYGAEHSKCNRVITLGFKGLIIVYVRHPGFITYKKSSNTVRTRCTGSGTTRVIRGAV